MPTPRAIARFVLVAAAVLVALLVAEGVCALLHVAPDRAGAVRCDAQDDGRLAIELAELESESCEVVVDPEKDPETLRVVMVGDSTVHGFTLSPHSTIARFLDVMLDRVLRRPCEVVNLGVPGVNAARVAVIAEFADARLHPDLIVAYTGHNEFLPEATERELRRLRHPVAAALLDGLRTFRVGRLLARPFANGDGTTLVQPQVGPGDAWVEARSRTAAVRETILERFSRAIERMTRVSAPLLLVEPVSNGREYCPIASAFSRELGERQQEDYRNRLVEAARRLEESRLNEAEALLDALESLDPDVALLRHLRATIAWRRGDEANARRLNLEAWALDENARAASADVVDRLRRVAADRGVPLASFAPALERVPRAGELRIFFDHCHPTAYGQYLFARELAVAIAALPAFGGVPEADARARTPDLEEARVAAGVPPEVMRSGESLSVVGDLFYALTAPDPAPYLARARAAMKARDPGAAPDRTMLAAALVLALFDGDAKVALSRHEALRVLDPALAGKIAAVAQSEPRLRAALARCHLHVESGALKPD